MRTVLPDPDRSVRLVNIVGCLWIVALVLAYILLQGIPCFLFLSFFLLSIALLAHMAWHIPMNRTRAWVCTHFRLSVFFILPWMSFEYYAEYYDESFTGNKYPESWVMIYITMGGGFLYYLVTLQTLAVIYAILQRFREFPDTNECQACGYNLTGNTSGTCPECGTPTPALIQSDSKEKDKPQEESQAGDPNCSS